MLGQVQEKIVSLFTPISPVGLDIGSSNIKFCQLRSSRRGTILHRIGLYQLPERALNQGEVGDHQALIAALKEATKKFRIKTREVIFSAPSRHTLFRRISLPPMPAEEISDAIKWEIEDILPTAVEEMLIDYEKIDNSGENGSAENIQEMQLFVVAIRREIIEGYLEVLRRAGFYPAAVDVEPLALERVFKLLNTDEDPVDDSTQCLVDIGSETTKICFFTRNRLAFTRIVRSGGDSFTEKLASLLNVSLEEAELYKNTGEMDDRKTIYSIVADLIDQIEKSTAYFTSHFNHNIEKILLTGGGARLYYLPEIIEDKLKTPSEPVNIIQSFHLPRRYYYSYLFPRASMTMGTSLGLALRGSGKR